MEVCQLKKNYSIGLDIGNTSVGWAVIGDDDQKIIKKGKGSNRKALWGVRLFESADTASERRNFRSTRRRYDRRRWRISLLKDIFAEEIQKVDKNFFQKLQETFYNEKDCLNKKIHITAEERIKIKEYNNKYKTIYHLRKRLIENKEKEDIRLIYLAIHHIIKYRGNFLYNFKKFNVNTLDLSGKLKEIFENIANVLDFDNTILNYEKICNEMTNESKNDVKVGIIDSLKDTMPKDFINEFIKLINGNKFDFNKMLSLENDEPVKLSFNGSEYDDKFDELSCILSDNIEILESLKELYDMLFLKRLFKNSNCTTISTLMVNKYEVHKKDLKYLKELLGNDRKEYNRIFRNKLTKCIYEKYLSNEITKDDFYREINVSFQKVFNGITDENLIDIYNKDIQKRILNGTFMPKITDVDNGKFPYQLNKDELIKIIENQGKYYPFLLEKSDNGKNKVVQLLEFKIPYYVGPLVSGDKSTFAWMEKIKQDKVTPYNFDEVVDKEKTAEKFIKRMVSHCTYFLDELSLPNDSILYSKFKVINELKQIRVNGYKLDKEVQKNIIENLFKKHNGTITDKAFKKYINDSVDFSMYKGTDIIVTGYSSDLKFANNLQSYYDFFGENGIFSGTNYTLDDADLIIEWITVFEDKDILESKVRKNYNLNDNAIRKILNRKYKGWGSLSKKFLTEKYYNDKSVGLKKSILDLMEETEENFMQVLNNEKYKFQDMIKKHNNLTKTNRINYSVVNELATSPSTKKGIYQSIKVINEIVNFMGSNPKYISIEMSRESQIKKRTQDRKKYILELYKNVKNEVENYNDLIKKLNSIDKINSEKMFLYFIQEGKSLYSGTPLNIENLNEYEIDHIIPRTLIKDDSLDNKALVLREENQIKSSNYVLPSIYRTELNKRWWEHLKKVGLISPKKFHNLIRNKYSDDDITGFINRQLVETRQITKHVANILENFYKDTKIIYLKANLSHNYRKRYELFKFRDINDYHHAHDAYLAAVLGEYKERHLIKKINFDIVKDLNKKLVEDGDFRKLKYGFIINSLDSNVNEKLIDIMKNYYDEETGELLFDVDAFNKEVENTLYRNDILLSRKVEYGTGQFYKQKIYKRDKGTIPIKKNLPVSIYGGYSNTNTKYLMLISYNENQKKLIGLPVVMAVKNDQEEFNKFIESQINLKKMQTYKILKKEIPFETEMIYKGQKIFIKGYSIIKKNCEVSNATQLKISKDNMKRWKYALEYLLNGNEKYVDESNIYINEIYDFLIDIKLYPLFEKEIEKIKTKLDFKALSFEQKKKIIKEIFKMYHCNSVNANLSEFGLGDRMGRLNGNNIVEGVMIFKSITGIMESKYEF